MGRQDINIPVGRASPGEVHQEGPGSSQGTDTLALGSRMVQWGAGLGAGQAFPGGHTESAELPPIRTFRGRELNTQVFL